MHHFFHPLRYFVVVLSAQRAPTSAGKEDPLLLRLGSLIESEGACRPGGVLENEFVGGVGD